MILVVPRARGLQRIKLMLNKWVLSPTIEVREHDGEL